MLKAYWALSGATLGNNGVMDTEKDTGHDGWTLADFHAQEQGVAFLSLGINFFNEIWFKRCADFLNLLSL